MAKDMIKTAREHFKTYWMSYLKNNIAYEDSLNDPEWDPDEHARYLADVYSQKAEAIRELLIDLGEDDHELHNWESFLISVAYGKAKEEDYKAKEEAK